MRAVKHLLVPKHILKLREETNTRFEKILGSYTTLTTPRALRYRLKNRPAQCTDDGSG
jgi:hypothetical protein